MLPPSPGKWATWLSLHFHILSRHPGAAAPSSLQTPFLGQSPLSWHVCAHVSGGQLGLCACRCVSLPQGLSTRGPEDGPGDDVVSPRVQGCCQAGWGAGAADGGDLVRSGQPSASELSL